METQAITKTFPLYSLLPSGVLPSSRILGHNILPPSNISMSRNHMLVVHHPFII